MADISGLIVGGIGSIAAVVALVYAHIANNNAKKSTRIANESRDLAVESNDLSKLSNTIASGARALAEEANEFSRRGEARETEHHDVRWEEGWTSKKQGIYRLVKRGDDEAHNVKASVTFDDEELMETAPILANDNAQLLFRFGSAAYERDRAKIQEALRRQSFTVPMSMHVVKVRIAWTTNLGTPQLYENTSPASLVKLPGH